MTEQTVNNILPKSDEDREKFFARMNEWIGLEAQIQSAKSSQNSMISAIVDDHMEKYPEDSKKDVKTRVMGHLKEFLEGKITAAQKLNEVILDEQELIEKKLNDL